MAHQDVSTGGDLYPVQLSIDYPEARDRLSALVRIVLALPILAIFALIGGAFTTNDPAIDEWLVPLTGGGALWLPILLMILFRKKYPRWWFDWNLELNRFSTRVFAYVMLLRDEYPSTDEKQAVSVDIEYPDVESELNRWLPIVKWLLAIPHYIVLAVLWTAVLAATIIAWLAILIVGQYPRAIFTFVEGTLRWSLRVIAYAFLLTTDRYPPFRLSP